MLGSRRWFPSRAGLIGAVAACAFTACSTFDASEPPVTSDLQDASTGERDGSDPSVVDAGVVDAAPPKECLPLSPKIAETFDQGADALVAHAELGGTVSIDANLGWLVTSVPSTTGAQAYFGKVIAVPSGMAFSHASVRYTMKGLERPPEGHFVLAGCTLDFRQNDGTRSSIRLELRSTSMRLDDMQLVDGTIAETGVGPEIASFIARPTDYVVSLDISVSEDAKQLLTVGHVNQEPEVSKTTPLAGLPVTMELHCGIEGVQVTKDGGVYPVNIDDVFVDVCRAPSP